MRFLTAVALALVMLRVPVDGVAQETSSPLKGIPGVTMSVLIGWDDEITGLSEAVYTSEVERAFELGLLRAGVKIDVDDPSFPFLYCDVTTMASSDGNTVVYSYEVYVRQSVLPLDVALAKRVSYAAAPGPMFDDAFYATTWSSGTIGEVGINNLRTSAATRGQRCAEMFELAWRRANN